MLRLQNIKKTYRIEGGTDVHALKGIDIRFRKNEFVSILGPSGCGKTTLLNIIGGLDTPSEGVMSINGASTADFKDRDWDTYRNHSIGFVFQSYNLIPHMSVLANVEMAPIISGVSKSERKKRAIAALQSVGLGDQMGKKPNQLSGGQMQRVAIARALVNDPEILLADEPTGALDTETSVQIMEILKNISKDRLIIMVTHNPELAEQYSSRIVRLKDGLVVGDSDPYDVAEYTNAPETPVQTKKEKKEQAKKQKKASMSFLTALSLSTRNLLTKKGRALLTSFAGSIGIIGIALILALSTGVKAYVNRVQEDTLSSYPLTISAQVSDTSAIASAMLDVHKPEGDEKISNDKIYTDDTMGNMISAMYKVKENDLPTFVAYFREHKDELKGYLNAYRIIYDLNLQLYANLADGNVMQVNPTSLFSYMGESFSGMMSAMSTFSMGNSNISFIGEMLEGIDGELINPLIKDQYELVGKDSRWPTRSDEILLVVDENNRIANMSLYALGFKDPEKIEGIMEDLMKPNSTYVPDNISYDISEIIGHTFRYVMNTDYFRQGEGKYTVNGVEYPVWEDVRNDPTYDAKTFLQEKGRDLTIVGVIRNLPDATSTSISTPLAYTSKLTKEVIDYNNSSAIAQQQLATADYDVFSGVKFKDKEFSKENADEFLALLSSAQKAELISTYNRYLDMAITADTITQLLSTMDSQSFSTVVKMVFPAYTKQTAEDFVSSLNTVPQLKMGLIAYLSTLYPDITDWSNDQTVATVLKTLPDTTFTAIVAQFSLDKPKYTVEQLDEFFADLGEEGIQQLVDTVKAVSRVTEENLEEKLKTMDDERFSALTGSVIPENTAYNANLSLLGYQNDDRIVRIALYATDFAGKDKIKDFIDDYNKFITAEKGEEHQVEVSDFMGSLMSWVSTVVDVISWVLIAFVAISLVVSSIMIAIITYISVLERTKEIGILRSLGASKKNIRYVFNAETLIEGFCAGLLGVLVTYGLCALINPVIHALAGVDTVSAFLPFDAALILIGISMLLTLVAGLIPAQMASKKDPVIALRTE